MAADKTDTFDVDPLDPGDEATVRQPAEVEPPDAKPARKRSKRTWKRRLWLTLIVVLILCVVMRIAVQIAFPIVLDRVAAGYGLDADYDQFRMSMLSGDVGLGRLEFKSQKSGEVFASANYVRATISPLKLLIGRLEVWRVEADGVDLHVTREADGAVPVLDELFKARIAVATEKQVEKKPVPSQSIDFSSPAQIEGFRLQHLRVHLTDKTHSPPMQTMAQLDLRVDDIGSSQRPTSFYMGLSCDAVLDALTIEGQGRVGGASIDADVRIALKGLHLKPLAQYLEPLGVRPVSYDISAFATGTLKTSPASLVSALSEIAAATRPGSRPASTGPAAAPALASATATQPANPPTQPAKPPTQPVDTAFPTDPKPAEFVGGSLKLANLSLLTDGREAAACDVFEIDIARAKLGVLHLSRILIDGVRASAVRNAEGNLVAAGIELIPVVPAARPTPVSTHSASPAAAASGRTQNGGTPNAATRPASPQVALDELLIRNLKLTLDDRFFSGNEPLAFEVERFSVRDLVLDPSRPDAQLTIAGAFRSSGIARSIALDGTARPFAQSKTLHLRLDVSGIQPTALQPYLDFAGLESNLQDASFTANLDAEATIDPSGKLGAAMRIGDISFRDGDELFGMNGVKLAGIELNPASGMLKVDEVEVVGPALAFKREKDGSFSGFGFRTKQATPYPDRPAPPPSEPMELRLGRLELGRFTWKDVAVRFEDDAAVPPASVAIGDARLEITDVVFDVNGTDLEDRMPGRIRGWLMAPGLAERLDVEGTLIPGPDSFAVRVQLSGDGITAGGLSSYLKTLGIEPLLKQGMFLAHVHAKVGGTADGIKASLAIEDAVYADGQAELAGVDLVKLDEITLEGSTLSLGLIEIRRPRATVTLEKDGAVVAAGMRYTPVMASKTAPSSPVPPSAVPSHASSSQVAPVAPAEPSPAPQTAVMLQGLQLTDAALTLNDQSAARPVQTIARVNATLGALALGRDGPPADLNLVLKVDNIVEQVTVTGKVLANSKAQGAVLDIDVAGLSGKALEGYLPDGTTFALTGGRLRTSIDAGVEQLEHGGIKGWLLVNGLDYRDGDGGPTLLKLDQFRITMPRFDLAGDAIVIDDVSLSGLEMETRKTADGAIQVLGLAVSNAVAPEAANQQPDAQQAAGQPAAAPAVANGPTATIPASAAADTTAIVARARQALPLITLNTLDLNVRRIGYLDLSSPGNKPLTIADLRLRTLEQLKLLGPDPMNQPPVKLQLTGRVDPLIGAVDVQLQTAPFAQQPSLNATVLLSGINGEGIFAVAPNLRELIDASELTDGQFRTKIDATATLDRRGPMDIDFAKGFDVQAIIQGIELRTRPGGQIALGLEELRVEDAKVRPVRDDAGNQVATSVRIKAVDLSNPIGRLVRDKDGIRVAGLLVKMPAGPTTQPSTPAAAEPPAAGPTPAQRPATGAPPATAPAIAAAKPAGEIQIDKFTISGIDFRVVDRSVEPPFVLPLTALDLDVRGLTNLAMHEPDRPIRFSANLNSGKVSLPRKIESKGIVGAVGGVANLIGAAAQQKPAKQAPIEYEQRELFSQISINGKLSLYPQADGYLKLNVSSFEIPAVAGYAKEQDVTLSYGTFNLPLNLRGDGKGGFVVDTRPAFTDLSITDPQSLIARSIGLSVPTDVAIGSVEAADKSISIPVVGVTITPDATGAYNIGGIQKQILPAVTSVFLSAIRPDAMGSKVVGGALAMAGIEGLLAGKKKPDPPVVLSFPSGFAGLEPLELAKLRSLAERMKREPDLTLSVKHELGGSDLAIMQVRANPTTADAEAMAYALRQRKLELAALRGEVAATTRTKLAAGSDDSAAPAVEQLRAIDRELSRTEDAMDRMYDLLRPGAERQAPRRTRAAALDLGQQRLDAIRAVLVSGGVQGLTDRLNLARPAFDAADKAEGGTATITLVKVKK